MWKVHLIYTAMKHGTVIISSQMSYQAQRGKGIFFRSKTAWLWCTYPQKHKRPRSPAEIKKLFTGLPLSLVCLLSCKGT